MRRKTRDAMGGDGSIVTARNPDDLPVFCAAMIALFAEVKAAKAA